MNAIKKTELITIPQEDRVAALETHVIAWMNQLEAGERLVIGLPQVLGSWEKCTPLVAEPGHQDQFLTWLRENVKGVRGPIYNLPPLNASFLLVVIDEEFDPRVDMPPDDSSKELLGVLMALSTLPNNQESQAA